MWKYTIIIPSQNYSQQRNIICWCTTYLFQPHLCYQIIREVGTFLFFDLNTVLFPLGTTYSDPDWVLEVGAVASTPLFSQTSSNADWAPQVCSRIVMLLHREKVWVWYVSFHCIPPDYEAILHTPACALTSPGEATPRWVVTQPRKIARRGRGRSVGRRTDSSQQLQRKDRYISHLNTIRFN